MGVAIPHKISIKHIKTKGLFSGVNRVESKNEAKHMRNDNLINKSSSDSSNVRDQASAKADGASLEMGSSEYKEMLRDHQGMDEHEQDRQKKAQSARKDFRVEKWDEKAKDDFHASRENKLANEIPEKVADFVKRGSGALTRAEYEVAKHVRKMAAGKSLMGVATRDAEATVTKDDDKFVKDELPGIIDKAVYDNADEDDDIYPGSRLLNKFM